MDDKKDTRYVKEFNRFDVKIEIQFSGTHSPYSGHILPVVLL